MDDIWWNTVDYVKKRVVRLKWYEPFYFNGAVPTAPVATGFIVEGGYILTNQHVVTPGGFRGRCYFWDKEEADVFPVYRDAEHDFGILRIDPEFLKTHCLTGLELKPGLVRVGMEVCMLGNDAGQQLSISKGVVSRLDATSHMYYNTNYIQAAVGATGGSSGSPVVNRDGHVVGIQAAGFFLTNIDLFVPLDRPSRVLRCLLQDKPVSRGTLQCVFGLKSFEVTVYIPMHDRPVLTYLIGM